MNERTIIGPALRRRLVVVGLLLRPRFRAELDVAGIKWVEHRGWLDSHFVVTVSDGQWRATLSWIDRVNAA